MKFFIGFLVLTLAATLANCDEISVDEVIDIIQENNPDLSCIGLQCRLNCYKTGYRSGYCENDACVCVAPISFK